MTFTTIDNNLNGGCSCSESLTGGTESDRFILSSGLTADRSIILNYQDGIDLFELTDSLTFGSLTITQVGEDTAENFLFSSLTKHLYNEVMP